MLTNVHVVINMGDQCLQMIVTLVRLQSSCTLCSSRGECTHVPTADLKFLFMGAHFGRTLCDYSSITNCLLDILEHLNFRYYQRKCFVTTRLRNRRKSKSNTKSAAQRIGRVVRHRPGAPTGTTPATFPLFRFQLPVRM